MDARLVFQVLRNQLTALTQQNADQPDSVAAFHFLTTTMENPGGFDAVFEEVRGAPAPSPLAAREAISRLLAGRACERRVEQTLSRLLSPQLGWPVAYALSWILVAGGDSVMPPWVRAQFRETALIVRHLRVRKPGLRLVQREERPGPRAVALVRVRCLPRAAGGRYGPPPAGADRR
jgi:ATP-dependent DNA helicase RecQ